MLRLFEKIRLKLNDRGSALITVLIAITLLTILGTGLLMVSVTGLRRAIVLSGSNKAFYLSDGAIEESLAEINDIAFEAESIANNHIENAFSFRDTHENIFDALELGALDGVFLSNTIWEPYLLKIEEDMTNDIISEEEAMEYIEVGLRSEFLVQYYSHFLDSSKSSLSYTLLNGDSYLGSLDDIDALVDEYVEFGSITSSALNNTIQTKLESVSLNDYVENVDGYEGTPTGGGGISDNPAITSVTSSFSETDDLSITLITDGTYNEHRKELELKVVISEPKYQYVFKTTTGQRSIIENEVFDYAVLAGKDIIASGGETRIVGNTYAYGSYPETGNQIDHNSMGGIAVGYKKESNDFLSNDLSGFQFQSKLTESGIDNSGSLYVEGDLFTRSNIKIYGAGNDLTVTRELGANEFRTDDYTSGTDNTDVTIDGNMYLFEDFVLRGAGGNTNVRIGKDGTSDGDLYIMQSFEGNDWQDADLSGSIIIQEDIASKVDVNLNKLFISGVAFSGNSRPAIADDGSNKKAYFMTGESVNVENRYIHFYQSSYAEANYAGKLKNYDDVMYYYDVVDGQPVGADGLPTTAGHKYMEKQGSYDDVEFKTDAFIAGATNGSKNSSSVEVDDEDKEMIKIRSINGKGDYKKNYALGVILGKDNSDVGSVYNPDFTMSYSKYESSLLDTILNTNTADSGRDVDRRMNYLATRYIREGENNVFAYVTPNPSAVNKPDLNVDTGAETRLSQLVDFSVGLEEISSFNNIRIVNGDATRDIYINPPSSVSGSHLVLGNDSSGFIPELGGIIATKGDVYIYAPEFNNVKFKGLLAVEGRVIFYGKGTKQVETDRAVNDYQVAAYTDLGNAFYASEGRKVSNLACYYTKTTAEINPDADGLDVTGSGINNPSATVIDGHPPAIAVIPGGESINVSLEQPPILMGMQKNKGLKRYKIEYWRQN